MKLTSQTIARGGSPICSRSEAARVEPFVRSDARVGFEARVELAMADVDRDDVSRPAREQHVGKAARRRADVEAGEAARIERESVERRRELEAAARGPGMRGARLDRGVAREGFGRLAHERAVGAHEPGRDRRLRAGAAGNSPRSTSRISARWRMGRIGVDEDIPQMCNHREGGRPTN